MLEIGKVNEVKFKVGVNGTQATPSVRLVITANGHELGFPAEKSLEGDDSWFSEVKLPEDIAPGQYDFRVEVVVNNRLFTPIKKQVEVAENIQVFAYMIDEKPSAPVQPPPTVTEIKKPDPQRVREKPQLKNLMKEAAAKTEPRPALAPKPIKKIVTPLPKPTGKKAEPVPVRVRISMAEIAEESNKKFDHSPKEVPEVAPSLNLNHQVPITLTKGEIVYE